MLILHVQNQVVQTGSVNKLVQMLMQDYLYWQNKSTTVTVIFSSLSLSACTDDRGITYKLCPYVELWVSKTISSRLVHFCFLFCFFSSHIFSILIACI